MIFKWNELGIDVSKVRGGKTACPKCSHTRKNKKDPCLSVDLQTGMYNCHNGCGFKGTAAVFEKKKEYTVPVPRLEKLSKKSLEFFEQQRKISNNTLLRFGITEGKDWMPQFDQEVPVICFNYFRDEKLVNIKFRGPKKSFKMQSGAELIFYNLDAIKDEETCVIVEGEIDCLSLHEAGIYNAVSVPNGANKGQQRLEYLDNCWQYFETKQKVILAVDNDDPGLSLREELARRIGKEKCLLVNYPDGCKDANEVLIKFGKDSLRQMIDHAKLYPLEGVLEVGDMAETVLEYFENGYPAGASAGIEGFDDHLTFVPGQLTMITGIPGHGKDEFVNYIATGLSINADWKFGVIPFEEPPAITVTKLIEKHAQKAFGFRSDPWNRMTQDQFEKGILFVDDYFKFVNTDEVDVTVEGIIEKIEQLVRRYGINAVIISPWNCFEHAIPYGMNETQYIGMVLGKLISCLKRNHLHGFLIAHPTKVAKNRETGKYDVPTLYMISGSAHFFNKTHNGMCIYRDIENNITDVYIQKVKWSWLGKLGFCSFRYDTLTRQYTHIPQ